MSSRVSFRRFRISAGTPALPSYQGVLTAQLKFCWFDNKMSSYDPCPALLGGNQIAAILSSPYSSAPRGQVLTVCVRLRVDQNLRIAFLSLAYKLQDLPTLPVLLAGVKDAGQKKNVCLSSTSWRSDWWSDHFWGLYNYHCLTFLLNILAASSLPYQTGTACSSKVSSACII